MATAVVEIVGSREANVSVENPSVELLFTAFGSFDDAEIRAAIEATLPETYSITSTFFGQMTLVPQSYHVKQKSEGNANWEGSATYGRLQPRKTGQLWFSFDGTGGTTHVNTSEETVRRYERAPTPPLAQEYAPDYKQAIGVSNDTVEGVDKVIPYFKFRLDYYPETAKMTAAYILQLYELTGKTNNEEVIWGGITFGIGELLFLGPTGQPRGFDDWELGLHFIASPDVEIKKIGDIPADPEDLIKKGGHEYLWVQFVDSTDKNVHIKVPRFAMVERIYDSGNFSELGIEGIPIQGIAGG